MSLNIFMFNQYEYVTCFSSPEQFFSKKNMWHSNTNKENLGLTLEVQPRMIILMSRTSVHQLCTCAFKGYA